jgi:anthranilate synthase component 1
MSIGKLTPKPACKCYGNPSRSTHSRSPKNSLYYGEMDNAIALYSVTKTFINDLVTPISAYLTLHSKDSFFLESVTHGHRIGRFSIIGYDPLYQLKGYDDHVIVSHGATQTTLIGNPITILSDYQRAIQHDATGDSATMLGFFGYFNWHILNAIEAVTVQAPPNKPAFNFQIPRVLIVFDHALQRIAITLSDTKPITNTSLISDVYTTIKQPLPADTPIIPPPCEKLDWSLVSSNWTQSDFEAGVDTMRHHIREGDIFQAVLSQRFSVPQRQSPLTVYRSLRHINPSPYMFYFNYGDYQLIGSSPEVLVKSTNGTAWVRPIAGTRKRSDSDEAEQALIECLTSDPKEVAEHMMLVDLGRNDLGRVCAYNSITVDERMIIERYSHVMHMVSNIRGTLLPNVSPIDLFKATFPAGTVSGAPKRRAIQIIDAIETDARSIYAGGVGYFDFNTDCDFCIAIRTIVAENGRYFVQAGAGIVADSDPYTEYRESQNKAQGVLLACLSGATST